MHMDRETETSQYLSVSSSLFPKLSWFAYLVFLGVCGWATVGCAEGLFLGCHV